MARVGFIGCGKLGFPVAVAMANKGHTVAFVDPNFPAKEQWETVWPFKEEGYDGVSFDEYLQRVFPGNHLERLYFVRELVIQSDIIFVAVQTPHAPQYEGVTPRDPSDTADFDYSYLEAALRELVRVTKEPKTVCIISTVAPGTYAGRLKAILAENPNLRYVYNPFFIAMGTVVRDFLDPEFVLIGCDDLSGGVVYDVMSFYASLHHKPVRAMSIASAELVKMKYNTYITTKIVLANDLLEWCEAFGGDADDVADALKSATDRIVSAKYMTPGMGDGGGCHPRDNIVMSHLARQEGFSYDVAGQMMQARERQAGHLADMAFWDTLLHNGWAMPYQRPIVIAGLAFKPETNIRTGSCAVLIANMLRRPRSVHQPDVHEWEPADGPCPVDGPAVFLIGCKHEFFKTFAFPKGSVVIDPFRFIPPQEGVTVRRIGEGGR